MTNAENQATRPAPNPGSPSVEAVPEITHEILVEIVRVVILQALDPNGSCMPRSEVERWLDALCYSAKVNIRLNGGDHVPDNESLVVSITDNSGVHDRTEVQLSDGAVGDSGETNDGG